MDVKSIGGRCVSTLASEVSVIPVILVLLANKQANLLALC